MGEGLDQDEGKVVIFNLWKSVKLDLEIYALFFCKYAILKYKNVL